ncbi:MarR family winged helix-turn-helix transcriptional regulator [Saccharopolyspora oryzae]|uniref:MarR family winged helix-turn-helix transcriptional regulator n=1 Tax=Saccharopolyspora oryzae TaxID=2997343 RepID=A0ABT4UQ71_9PSEU|nr:MarR family winged helix-turn-helix transcriptional regulator [Saccharopolyspora oryzae]MDA3623872.1 MarR family winged helix-turn-helix transcriptional regulator [Saccharopolyspora oryzae]
MTSEADVAEVLTAAIGGLGPLTRRLYQVHTRLWHEQVDRDLTGPQFTVLSLLDIHGDMDQGTLGSLAHLDKSTAAPLLDRLRRRGLVEFAKDDADRRRKLVALTADGRELAERLAPSVIAISEQMLAVFTPEERQHFLVLLHRLLEAPQTEEP